MTGVTDNNKYFRKLCYDGMYRIYGKSPDKIVTDRMEYELSVISKMGYTDYYLIVWDFIRYAKSNNIPVGPGRGSGAGSLCAYCIGITGIDPIKYNQRKSGRTFFQLHQECTSTHLMNRY